MDLHLSYHPSSLGYSINIPGSKSESNRLLILQQLFPNLTIKNLSDSDDTHHLQVGLATDKVVVDIGHAGTSMRFLTAFFSCQEGKKVVLTGSERMQNRPIKILVSALKNLGATIEYLEKNGYPPIEIKGKTLLKNKVQLPGDVSSQYISALLLIAPSLPKGLEVILEGNITSVPYIKMTLSLLSQLGIETTFIKNKITVFSKKSIVEKQITVESDWSSASYFYSIIALSDIGTKITLSSYKKESLQGDSYLSKIYKYFGVTTEFHRDSISLKKERPSNNNTLILNLKETPDIAQTIVVTCFGLQIECHLSGLHTLRIKETDRLEALRKELTKLGAKITVTKDSLHLKTTSKIKEKVHIKTYDDHRMAMAFSPLAIKVPITILEATVVTKSYRTFWEDIKKVGIF